MAYYDALIAEWANLSGTTEEKLAAVNAMTVAGSDQLVSIADVMSYLRENGLWLPIKAAAGSNQAAAAAVDIAGDLRAQTIDFNLPLVKMLLTALVASGLLTQANADALAAMKNTTQLWWQVKGYSSPFSENDLIAAGGLS